MESGNTPAVDSEQPVVGGYDLRQDIKAIAISPTKDMVMVGGSTGNQL